MGGLLNDDVEAPGVVVCPTGCWCGPGKRASGGYRPGEFAAMRR